MSNNGRLDGIAVDLYNGRFSGSFEIDEEVGESIAYDDVVSFLVVGTAGKANFNATSKGDLKRTNVFEVTNVMILTPEVAASLLHKKDNSGQLTILDALHNQEEDTFFDEDEEI